MSRKFSYLRDGAQKYCGAADGGVTFTVAGQLKEKELWRKFVEAFEEKADAADNGWRASTSAR